MRTILNAFLMIFMAIGVYAQIQTHISGYENDKRRYLEGPRRYIGSFDIETPPAPLSISKVNFSFEVTDLKDHYGPDPFGGDDWLLKVEYADHAVSIIGDTTFLWPGPHRAGDRFNRHIEFMPLRSGIGGISIALAGNGRDPDSGPIGSGMGFRWCLSPDGELRYLGKGEDMPQDCDDFTTLFFKNDSVLIGEAFEMRKSYAFEYRMLLTPLPKIGDTTTLHYYLRANEDIPGGCDIKLDAYCVEVVSLPKRMNNSITTGQVIEDSLKFISNPVRDRHGITIDFQFEPVSQDRFSSQAIGACFIFDEIGNLKYINDQDFSLYSEKFLPSNFPPKKADDLNIIDIKRNDNDSL